MLHSMHAFPGNGRIPSSLFDVYLRYKQDTRAIVAWLTSCASCKHNADLSIQDLLDLADVVRQKAVKMPTNIAFHFREAIAARTQMSNYFKKASAEGMHDQDTLNHEYFTMR